MLDKPIVVKPKDAHWLDKIIEEQAAHYGLTVQQHARLMRGAAAHQELIDKNKVREDGKPW